MMGVIALMGWPLSPWHELHTCNFSAMSSAAPAGAASAAEMTRAARMEERWVLIMVCAAVVGVPAVAARPPRRKPKHAAVRRVAQAGRSDSARFPLMQRLGRIAERLTSSQRAGDLPVQGPAERRIPAKANAPSHRWSILRRSK